mmetsp:Transcript_24276/g.21545  ORF Transcript_24276/g.21545 Transcript_24276/m.21545 type:complete len:97 (+) Transcript_24276:310-600(+)
MFVKLTVPAIKYGEGPDGSDTGALYIVVIILQLMLLLPLALYPTFIFVYIARLMLVRDYKNSSKQGQGNNPQNASELVVSRTPEENSPESNLDALP